MKKGESSSSFFLVWFIIAIAGFLILGGFLFLLLQDDGSTDRELCRLSVLSRATAPDELQGSIPLKCQTEKICFTSELFGECDQFAGEDNVRRVRLSGSVESMKRTIEEESANAMYDCWSMMGEGKLNLFAKEGDRILGSKGEPTCVICSRVAFAGDVFEDQDANLAVSQSNVQNYMERTQVPGKAVTYLEAFTDRGVKAFASSDKLELGINENKVSGSTNAQMAIVFSQVRAEEPLKVLSNLGAFTVGATAAIPFGGDVAKVLFLSNAAVTVASATAATAVGSLVAYNAYKGQQAASLFCGDFTQSDTSDNLKGGCSLVQSVNYNVQDINTLCRSSIESRP